MTKHVNLRLPDEVHEKAVAAASADDRSLNSWLVATVRRAIDSTNADSADLHPPPQSEQP